MPARFWRPRCVAGEPYRHPDPEGALDTVAKGVASDLAGELNRTAETGNACRDVGRRAAGDARERVHVGQALPFLEGNEVDQRFAEQITRPMPRASYREAYCPGDSRRRAGL